MPMLSSLIKSADWKAEKHVPVITVHSPSPASPFLVPHSPIEIEVSVGKEIPHPNTLEHHIAWAALYFVADGSQLPVELARTEFRAHGPDLFTTPVLKATVALPTPLTPTPTPTPTQTLSLLSGTLHAVAYCNIHGLWESNRPIAVVGPVRQIERTLFGG